jgi:hypothetical protein
MKTIRDTILCRPFKNKECARIWLSGANTMKGTFMNMNRHCDICRRTLLALVGLAITAGAVAIAQQNSKQTVSGHLTLSVMEAHKLEAGDVAGHTLSIGRWEGTNVSTGAHQFFDGAKITIVGFGDVVNGAGPDMGYDTMVLNGEAVFIKYNGHVDTAPNNGSIPTMAGKFSFVGGTGPFEHIQGTGTYKGQYTSEKTASVEWQGEYVGR